MTRRAGIAVAATGAVLLATWLVAQGQAPSAASLVHGRKVLTLWRNQVTKDNEIAANQAVYDRFNASQNQWYVTAQALPQGGYTQSVVAASLAGRLPCIMTVDSPKVASFVEAGHLRPIDGLVPADLLASVSPAALGRYQGHIYAVGPTDAALAIYTRRSTLRGLGVRVPTLDTPWSRAEFDDLLARIKASGRFAFALDLQTRDTKADWWTYAFSPILESFGGDLIDRATMRSAEGTLNGPAAQAFGGWFRNLFAKGYVSRAEPDDYAFIRGRDAMAYTGNWWSIEYRHAAGDDLLVLPPPDFGKGVVIGGGSWQWGISSTCPDPGGAAAFITFLMQPHEVAAMADAAGLVPATEAGAALSRDFRPGGSNRIFYDLMRRFARSRPATPAFPVISSAFFSATRNIMDGADPHDALDDAVDAIDGTLADERSAHPAVGVPQ